MVCKICNEKHGRHGGHFNKHLKNKHNINDYIEYIIKVDYDGIRPICKCGCGEYTTYHKNKFKEFVHGHNIQHHYNEVYSNRPNEDVKNLYKSGENGREISKTLDLPLTYVYKVIGENNLTRTMSDAKRIYELDQTVFDDINDEESAYWLGVLFADGYNHETRGSVVLVLKNDDIDILKKFSGFLNTNKPISRNNDYSSKIVIESKYMSKRLSSLGVIQAKTHTLEFPKLDKELIRHFIRGYFDGDGCITYGKKLNKNATISFVSCVKFLNGIDNNIDVKFSYTKRHKDRDDEILNLSSGGICNIMKIYDYLYKDSNVYMVRKKNKFEKWFKYYFDNTKLSNKTIKIKNELGL
jgi:hypothetical protein